MLYLSDIVCLQLIVMFSHHNGVYNYYTLCIYYKGHAVAYLVSIPDEVIGYFNWPNLSSGHHGSGVDSASKRNEYQESSWV
jgi:hypothetical protein